MFVGLPQWLSGKESACNSGAAGDMTSIPGSDDSLEEGMATHSSVLAWGIPWTEEPGRLQPIGSQWPTASPQKRNVRNKYNTLEAKPYYEAI